MRRDGKRPLDNFGVTTGYNFLADSFNLSPLNFSARTSVFNKKVNISVNWVVDPYIYQLDTSYVDDSGTRHVTQTHVNQFAWNHGKGLGQVSRMGFSLSTSLNPKARNDKTEKVNKKDLSTDEQAELEYIKNHPEEYVDFNIPWNVQLNYTFNYSRQGFQDASITQNISMNGDLSLTKKWKINFHTGYDFAKKQFVSTNIGISRDLHCWQMALTWVPFGLYQSYNLTINAKSTLLQDLKLNRRRSWYDR